LELAIRTNIEEPARGIVRTGTESVSVGEELDGVDVGVVCCKGLAALLLTDIPQLSERIASTGHELVVVKRVDAQAHNIAQVVCEFCDFLSSLNVPKHASHITGGCEDAAVVDEATAGKVARVPAKLSCHPCRAFSRAQIVDGADVVETTAGHIVAAGRVGASHDPGRAEGNCVHLVCSVCIPDDELTVLRGGHEMSPVGRPVHGVDLGEMALESPLGPHTQTREGLCPLARNIANCNVKISLLLGGTKIGIARHGKFARRTCGVGKFVLLALYSILQGLGIPTGDLDLLLDRFCVCVRHCECAMQAASMAVAAPGVLVVCGESRPESSGPAKERRLMRKGDIHTRMGKTASESARSGKTYGAGVADNALRVVFCDRRGGRALTGTAAAGREKSASPTTADPDRDRVDA